MSTAVVKAPWRIRADFRKPVGWMRKTYRFPNRASARSFVRSIREGYGPAQIRLSAIEHAPR